MKFFGQKNDGRLPIILRNIYKRILCRQLYVGRLSLKKGRLGDNDKIQLIMTGFVTLLFLTVKFNPKMSPLMYFEILLSSKSMIQCESTYAKLIF